MNNKFTNEHFYGSEIYAKYYEKPMQNKPAFTLAEVLVVLVIIGVIAVMLGIVIFERYQERQTVAQLRKSYSMVSSAFSEALLNKGPIHSWQISNTKDMFMYLKPYINVMIDCGMSTTDSRCLPKNYGRLNNSGKDGGYTDQRTYKSLLVDGSGFSFRLDNSSCNVNKGNNDYLKNVCGIAYIDTNGPKPPNIAGKDKFEFYVTKLGIYPRGSKQETGAVKLDGGDGCSNVSAKGYGCSAWVVTMGNMDYLHRTISW